MSNSDVRNRSILSSRRSFLATTTAAAGGLLATTKVSQGFLFRHSVPMDLGQLPSAWVNKEGDQKIQNYAKYLEGLRLKFVTPLQVIKAHAKTKGSLWNTLPPKSMWRAMAGTLQAADHIAATLGKPIKDVTSAYRSPAYNRRCPGAKSQSWHMQNFALDLQFGVSPRTVASVARQLRSRGLFKGGIGRYSSFTHIDTRGTNVDW
ncbi:D-Ala-D-Ala carboxypeptidase family metallohydrolase [Verrucomicrobiaceae bacterium 227]